MLYKEDMTESTKKILIIEDNEDNSSLVEKILSYYGFNTFVASHGKAALLYCETHQPDLILMDLSLPDIDGIELTRLLREKKNVSTHPNYCIDSPCHTRFTRNYSRSWLK